MRSVTVSLNIRLPAHMQNATDQQTHKSFGVLGGQFWREKCSKKARIKKYSQVD